MYVACPRCGYDSGDFEDIINLMEKLDQDSCNVTTTVSCDFEQDPDIDIDEVRCPRRHLAVFFDPEYHFEVS